MIHFLFKKAGYAALGFFVLLNVGAIRKNEDPISRTQTDPISYKKKLEETKDGVKGAPTPSFRYYEKEEFLVKSATQTPGEENAVKKPAGTAEVSEVDFEEDEGLSGEENLEVEEPAEDEDEDWWVEDDESEEENLEESGQTTDLQGGQH
jgi:hypothetical protein